MSRGSEENFSNDFANFSNDANEVSQSFEKEDDDHLFEDKQSKKTPFSSLNQLDADMSLARILQEQERRAFLCSLNSESEYFPYFRNDQSYSSLSSSRDSYFTSSFDNDNDHDPFETSESFSENENTKTGEICEELKQKQSSSSSSSSLNGSNSNELETEKNLDKEYESDEAFARALQEEEDRETTSRIFSLTGLNIYEEDLANNSEEDNSQEFWHEDDDEDREDILTYEELLALGEVVGVESKGLSSHTLSKLKRSNYSVLSNLNAEEQEQCVICRMEMEDGDECIHLPCNHFYHSECISKWFLKNKICPMCNLEVTETKA